MSAVFYGAGDFIGGVTARRVSTLAAALVSQAAGTLLLIVILPLLSGAPTRADLLWGAGAGLAGGAGVALLYRALAIGTMAVVAPITAVCAVAIPVLAGVLLGDRLGLQTTTGILLAMAAITLISQSTGDGDVPTIRVAPPSSRRRLPSGVAEALVSGVAIGLFFLALARTAPAAGMWPLLAARAASVTMFAVLVVARRTFMRMSAPVMALACVGGALDMLANALYLAATRQGALSGVVTLASLYPASTVVLARVVLGERLSRTQVVGIACALAAVVLIVSA